MILVVAIVCLWLAISGAIYTWLWFSWLRGMELLGLSVCNLLASGLLSPGVVTGHGVAPFPGGLALLLTGISYDRSEEMFNLAMWALTFVVFFVLDWVLKNRKTRSFTM